MAPTTVISYKGWPTTQRILISSASLLLLSLVRSMISMASSIRVVMVTTRTRREGRWALADKTPTEHLKIHNSSHFLTSSWALQSKVLLYTYVNLLAQPACTLNNYATLVLT